MEKPCFRPRTISFGSSGSTARRRGASWRTPDLLLGLEGKGELRHHGVEEWDARLERVAMLARSVFTSRSSTR